MPERRISLTPESQRTKPERIKPGEFKPFIERLEYLDKKYAGHLIIHCGASTVFLRSSKATKEPQKLTLFGIDENLGLVKTEVNNTDYWEQALSKERNVEEWRVQETKIPMTKITPRAFSRVYKNAIERAAEISREVKRREPADIRLQTPQPLKHQIAEFLYER